MTNISESIGLSREERLRKASHPIVLRVLEERFPELLAQALRDSEFATIYAYQPLLVLMEIESFDIAAADAEFQQADVGADADVDLIHDLIRRVEDWRKRLEYASLAGVQLLLLKDLHGQIVTNISPLLPVFLRECGLHLQKGEIGAVWFSAKGKSRADLITEGLQRRFFLLLLASISLLQRNREQYREAICSSGRMDPSLAVLVSFLHNYGERAAAFNTDWSALPAFYLREILKARPRRKLTGSTWLTFEKNPAVGTLLLPTGTCLQAGETGGEGIGPGEDERVVYQLLSDLPLSDMKLVRSWMVVAERNKERYPEAALGYVTALVQTPIPGRIFTAEPIGLKVHSPLLLLAEGVREVCVLFRFTGESLAEFDRLIAVVSEKQGISVNETLFKILSDSFCLSVSTTDSAASADSVSVVSSTGFVDGWTEVENFYIRLVPSKGLQLTFRLGEEFPAVTPQEGDDCPCLRLLMNPAAWLFPYSWARKMQVRSIHIRATVQGLRDICIYNELGVVDTKQAFTPFGNQGEKGSWVAFGSYEMACKRVTEVELAFNWQHLPVCDGGLKKYYEAYHKEIDNSSFRARTEYLQNKVWKRTSSADAYLFAVAPLAPSPGEVLTEKAVIRFQVPPVGLSHLEGPDDFRFGDVRSGFYRLVFTSPDMGFGSHEYRRLFAEVMMLNAHRRRKLPLPEPPLSPLMENPRLSYTAEEKCFFAVTPSNTGVRLSYIRPLSGSGGLLPDVTRPVALAEGPGDEGNLMMGISGAVGENAVRLYIRTAPLQREIDHACLPHTDWYYRNEASWICIDPSAVVRDDTEGLMRSGAVILHLPVVVGPEMVDEAGLFWICVAVHSHLDNCSVVEDIQLNVGEVVPVSSEEAPPVTSVPGLLSHRRVADISGVRNEEGEAEMRVRLSERIAHRQRALLPAEYEQFVLQEFPEIARVKYLRGVDAKGQNRSSVVTLALIHERLGQAWPLCDDTLLCRVERQLRSLAPAFVEIDTVNPVFEEVTVFCGISLKPGKVPGIVLPDIRKRLCACIAPWLSKEEPPSFGHSFSTRDIQGIIKENPAVEALHGIKLVHVTQDATGAYHLHECIPAPGEGLVIRPSKPWAILVPATHHYVKIVDEATWRSDVEFGDLEIENTFVIK